MRAEVHWARYLDGNRRVVLEADHARIVAEAGAAVFAFHPEWTVTGMCDPDCLACRRLTELITERSAGYEEGKADAEQAHAAAWDRATFDSTAYEQGKRDAAEEARAAERRHWEARFRNAEQAHAAALAEERQRVLSMRFTEFMAAIKKSCPCICHEYTRDINPHDGKCVCNGGDGMETLGVAAPRTLTADDEGYHSQRCLHCDHIRATHTLTASGCLGHAVPGREGAYCPCSEFIHDGGAA